MTKQKKPVAVVYNAADQKGALKDMGGSQSDVWNTILSNQAAQGLWTGNSSPDEINKQYAATVAALIGIRPRDELEGMMAAQLIAAHNAAMECHRRAMLAEQTFAGRSESLNQANKLSRTFTTLLDADTILIIDRDGQGVTLYGRGRDIEEIETAIMFEKSSCRWRVMGSASEVRMSGARKTIVEVLKGCSAAMSPADVAAETGMKSGNVRFLLRKMVEDGTVMKAERGKYLLDLSTPTHNAHNLTTQSEMFFHVHRRPFQYHRRYQ
jgi:hypothetical protein